MIDVGKTDTTTIDEDFNDVLILLEMIRLRLVKTLI